MWPSFWLLGAFPLRGYEDDIKSAAGKTFLKSANVDGHLIQNNNYILINKNTYKMTFISKTVKGLGSYLVLFSLVLE